jgi:hypothetical protein
VWKGWHLALLVAAAGFGMTTCEQFRLPTYISSQGEACPVTIRMDTSRFLAPYVRFKVEDKEVEFLIDTTSNKNYVNRRLGIAKGRHTITAPVQATTDFEFTDSDSSIGTPFLSQYAVELRYGNPDSYLSLFSPSCPLPSYVATDLIPISQRNYSANLQPGSQEFPIVYAQIAGNQEKYPLVLDSGWFGSDAIYGLDVIRINGALRTRLRSSGVEPREISVRLNFNCIPEPEQLKVLRADQNVIEITSETAAVISSIPRPTFDVWKPNQCTPFSRAGYPPIGLIGSFRLAQWGPVVIDPYRQMVWVNASVNGDLRFLPPHEALSIAWGRDDWAHGVGQLPENANDEAMRACNRKTDGCLIRAAISPYGEACLAVVRSGQQPVNIWERTSRDEAKTAALRDCANRRDPLCVVDEPVCNR